LLYGRGRKAAVFRPADVQGAKTGYQAHAADFSFGDSTGKNEACIACHGNQATVGTKSYIDPTNFGQTTHAKFGCTTCHDTLASNHPAGKSTELLVKFDPVEDNLYGEIQRIIYMHSNDPDKPEVEAEFRVTILKPEG
ncbi:MAG: hypothetical protein CVU46_15195, partial [Chloroflexi bacterium HGW-Chloroflexi-8]